MVSGGETQITTGMFALQNKERKGSGRGVIVEVDDREREGERGGGGERHGLVREGERKTTQTTEKQREGGEVLAWGGGEGERARERAQTTVKEKEGGID